MGNHSLPTLLLRTVDFCWMAQLRPQKGCLKSKGVSQTLRILMDMEFVVKSLFFVGFPSFFDMKTI